MSASQTAAPVVVGLALKREKRKKHISDKLVQEAANAGITLKFIDKELPLEEQGPFTAILQKVRKPGKAPGNAAPVSSGGNKNSTPHSPAACTLATRLTRLSPLSLIPFLPLHTPPSFAPCCLASMQSGRRL